MGKAKEYKKVKERSREKVTVEGKVRLKAKQTLWREDSNFSSDFPLCWD
ncbi:MAG: hypothetical protein ACK40G_09845 [Cytophagaceae bacterium]